MRTPITYYGGKQRIADRIIEIIPPHKIYCEPYFGGGAVFFAKPKSKIEVINDKRDDLINFYTCVQNNFDELCNLISQTLHSESMYYHAKDIWNGRKDANDIERAWAVWLITNGSFNGSMHGGWKWCNGTSGSHSGVYLANKRNSFTEELKERLSNVQISCRDALKVIKDRDSKDTFFYLDPPYPGCEQQHYSGFTLEDLEELLNILSTISGKFILSNYWSSMLERFIHSNNWEYKSIEVNLMVNRLNRKVDRQKRTEYLFYNFSPDQNLFEN